MKLTEDIKQEVLAVRHGAGAWLRDDVTFVRITGPDNMSWLQTQTSNDVLALASGMGQANAHLDRKGHLLGHFTVHRWEDELWLLVDKAQAPALIESLDSRLIMEDAAIEDAGDEVDQVVVQGSRALAFLASLLETHESAAELLPHAAYGVHPVELCGHETLAFAISTSGEDGFVLVAPAGEGRALLDKMIAREGPVRLMEVTPEARDVLRIEAGIPKFGVDMDHSNRLPETTLERDSVSYTKGCYVGQEVIAKLKTYSAVKWALMGLVLPKDAALPGMDTKLYFDGKHVGTVKSGTWSPTLERPIVLAYLERNHRAPNETLALSTESGDEIKARVVVLPFVEPADREERAQKLYDKAMEHFEADVEDTDDAGIEMLKEAVLLHPTFEDAYETLGVILHRHGRVDEAIHYMQILARLNPDCVMAHTNLSVFYVAKGMIDEAEEEKAKASVLQLNQARDAAKAEQMAKQERERLQQEARDRIAMFAEVLEIDPEDPLATFGMGQSYIQLNEYDNAIPHLEKATQVQKDYSAAWLNLGKCHEFLGHRDEAVAAYKKGIEAANRKGDFMPLREMERRIKGLDPSFSAEEEAVGPQGTE